MDAGLPAYGLPLRAIVHALCRKIAHMSAYVCSRYGCIPWRICLVSDLEFLGSASSASYLLIVLRLSPYL